MKKIILLLLIIIPVLYSKPVDALELGTKKTPDGIFILWGKYEDLKLSDSDYFTVHRKEADGEFKIISEHIRPISTLDELRKYFTSDEISFLVKFNDIKSRELLLKEFAAGSDKILEFSIFNPIIYQLCAMGYLDKTAQPGKTYTYFVSLNNKKETKILPFGKKEIIYEFSNDELPTPPENIKAKIHKNNVKINWDLVDDNKATMYNIYRKSRSGENYTIVNSKPLLLFGNDESTEGSFIDHSVTTGKEYTYRVKSLDMWHNESEFSDEITIFVKDIIKPPAPTGIVTSITNDGIIIGFTNLQSDSIFNFDDVMGLFFYGSDTRDGNYLRLTPEPIPVDAGYWIDKNVKPGFEYYYKASTVDYAGNESKLSPMFFETFRNINPPKPPENITIKEMNNNVVLTWKEDTTYDFLGNYVYRTNSFDEKPRLVSPLIKDKNYFKDSSKYMKEGHTYIYFVQSVNSSQIKSKFSNPVYFSANDTIPPTPITNLRGYADISRKVKLTWDPPIDNSVTGYNLYFDDSIKVNQSPISLLSPEYSFPIPENRDEIRVYVTSIDISGNESNNNQYLDIPISQRKYYPPASIIAAKNKDGIGISWDNPGNKVNNYNIYRKENDKFMKLNSSIFTENSYLDSSKGIGGRTTYKIEMLDSAGNVKASKEYNVILPE